MSDSRSKKEKNQHIQVFVRVRPPNASEKTGKSITVVDVPSNKDVVIKERPQDKLTKKFTFDKVFGPNSKQLEVYDAVVNPLVAEVLAGYNCTVFAYGQTGTGKTFTMEGVSNAAMHWKSDNSAGIIPRTLSHLFDELRVNDAQEYTVRVSFLELYNEELFDLLSPSDDASKIRLFEDASKKGSVIIHGLEEVTVHNKSEVYKILEKGSERRQTAATLMNAHSSRSHTVFSITIHIKENTIDGEELLKTGKMNLVDLAGSENVGRSGAVDRRAREAGNINQSLLTLGRVITALVERAPHVPYRESKLTRLLQESLGGRTKTSIIATISPSSLNLEETLSTLDYAHRAKNITNRPEINQKMSKKALLKEYTEEIERLRRDLAATRERNGVYLAQDNYNEMQTKIEYQDKEIEEKINHIKALEENMEKKEKIFNDLQLAFETQKQALQETEEQLLEKKQVLKVTKKQLNETKIDRDVQKHLVEKHVITEERLLSQANTLVDVADTATSDVSKLHDKIIRKRNVEEENANIEKQFQENISYQITHLEEDTSQYIQNLIQYCLTKKGVLDSQTSKQCSGLDASIEQISKELPNTISNITTKFTQSLEESHVECNDWLKKEITNTNQFSEQEISAIKNFFPQLSTQFRKVMENKIAENIESMKSDLTEKLAELAGKTNKSVQLLCKKFTENYDELLSEVQKMDELILQNFELEKQKLQERENINNEFSQVFTKMQELNSQFTKTMARAKSYMDKDTNQPVSKQLQTMSQMCNTITKNNKRKLEENLNLAQTEEGDVQENIKQIKLDLGSSLEQNRILAENTKAQCNDLVVKMETEINDRVSAIGSYQSARQTSEAEFREKLAKHQDNSMIFVQDVNKIVQNAGINHKETIDDQRVRLLNACRENKHSLDTKCVEMNEWRTQISTKLHTTKHQIDKFLLEDLRRDQPTGSTPVRKEFSYPRTLVTTSPHKSIVQRYKESIRQHSNSEDESIDDILNCNSNANYQTPMKEMSSTSLENNKKKVLTSTPKTHNSSDRFIMRNSGNLNADKDTREIKSLSDVESLTNNDKENGEDGLISKPQFKRISRLSQISRKKVLGSSN